MRLKTRSGRPERWQIAALFTLSAGSLGYELILMRLFSVLMWYHFASLAIGLALLGLGCGGAVAGLSPRWRSPRSAWFGAWGFSAGALLFVGFLAAVHAFPGFAQETLAPFHQPFYKPFARPESAGLDLRLALRLLGLALLAGGPFVAAGWTIASLLSQAGGRLHSYYGATFLGSAAGCLLAPLSLAWLSAPAGLALAAFIGAAAALLLAPAGTTFPRTCAWGTLPLALATLCWVQASGGAEVPFARGRYESNLLAVRWNPMSRVAAYPLAPGDEQHPLGLARTYRGPVPPQIGLVVDDSGYTNLFEGAASRAHPDYFRSNLVALPYHLRPAARALILGPGGGKDIWIALAFPDTRVHAVEINPQVIEMAEDVFGDFTGRPYADPRVTLTVTDGRSFVTRDPGSYDLIEASAVFGRMPPAAGAFTLSEDQLHTLEAFRAYWNLLAPQGILSVTRFAYEQRALRLTSLARALLEDVGIPTPADHIRVLSDRGLANVMVSREPFTPEDDAALRHLAAGFGFTHLYPAEGPGTALARIVEDPDLGAVLDSLPFDVAPPTDDRPFFYYTVRPADFLRGRPPDRPGFDNRGAEILRASFLTLLGLAVIGILLPPFCRWGVSDLGWRAWAPLLYAAALGAGYMAIEIGTMKRFGLFLGHPIYSAAATLFAFLLGGGIGSLAAARFAGTRRKLAGVILAAVVLGAIHALLVPSLLAATLQLPGPVRWALSLVLIFPPAVLLGMCFPAAMALLGRATAAVVPWAWAVNGATSVVGSLGAVLIAMNLGYTITLLAGAGAYLLAAVALALFPRVSAP